MEFELLLCIEDTHERCCIVCDITARSLVIGLQEVNTDAVIGQCVDVVMDRLDTLASSISDVSPRQRIFSNINVRKLFKGYNLVVTRITGCIIIADHFYYFCIITFVLSFTAVNCCVISLSCMFYSHLFYTCCCA